MATSIEKHVRERCVNFPRSPQGVEMKSSVENCAGVSERAIHGTGEPCADRLHAAGEARHRIRLEQQVSMVALQGVLQDAEVPALAGRAQASLKLSHEGATAQARQASPDPDRHVRRARPLQLAAFAVRNTRSRSARSAGSDSSSAATTSATKLVEG